MFVLLSAFAVGAASPPATRSVTLAWAPDTNPDVAGYIVYYGTTSRRYTRAVFAGNRPSATITGLTDRTTYYFVVTAQTSLGFESEPSNEVVYTVPPPPEGTYYGLFGEADAVRTNSAGFFSLSVTASRTFSGRLQIGKSRCSFSGGFDSFGRATTLVQRRGAAPLILTLNLGAGDQAGRIWGQVTEGSWTAELSGDRTGFDVNHPAPCAGNYTLIVPPQNGNATVPAGDSHGTVRIAPNGAVRFIGTLADGTKIAQSVPVSRSGWWPFYVTPSGGRGLVTGWLMFTNGGASDINGAVTWVKPADINAQYYSAGFTNESVAIASRYIPPNLSVPLLGTTVAFVMFSGGGLFLDFSNIVGVGPGATVINRSFNGLTIAFSLSTGTFTGKVTDPATWQTLSFSGVILTKFDLGRGFLLGYDKSSAVTFSP